MLINISTATPPYKSPQAKILEELKNRMGNNAKAARMIKSVSFNSEIDFRYFVVSDAAGVIAPLSGDGIGMAMESASLLADILQNQREMNFSKKESEIIFIEKRKRLFRQRLKTASILQRIMLNRFSREIAYSVASIYPTIIKSLIKRTRSNYHTNN